MLEVNIKLTSAVGSSPSFTMNKTPVVFTCFAHLYSMYKVSCSCFTSLENDWEMLCKYWITPTGTGLHLTKLVVLCVGKSEKAFQGWFSQNGGMESLMLWWGLLVNVLLILLAQGYGEKWHFRGARCNNTASTWLPFQPAGEVQEWCTWWIILEEFDLITV